MKTYKYLSCLLLGSILFVSCEDFLNLPPEDKFTDEEFWQTETQARTYLYSLYPTLFAGFGTTQNPTWMEDVGDDAISAPIQNNLSLDSVPETDGNWSFANIRKANYIIESAPRLNESEATINHWLGIGRFLRGYFYSSLTFQYGDVPWFDRVPQYSQNKADLDYLYKDRDPRNEVVGKIIEDFEFAMTNVRLNDGELQINRYVVAALVSRLMLREGTFQKYYYEDNAMAEKCLQVAKTASELVMEGPYALATDYKSLFTSEDLAGNSEIIMYRKYLDGILTHYMVNHNYDIEQNGAGKSLVESFLRSDGFPVYSKKDYGDNKDETFDVYATKATAFFANRDPRLSYSFRQNYYPYGGENAPFNYSRSGYSLQKYMNESRAGETITRGQNTTDAPCLRLGEVLLNYAEICYELNILDQGGLNRTINELRKRVKMPPLEIIGGEPAVKGQTYDDPQRTKWDPNNVSAMLWEIRRERRVELCYENGLRSADLKRWKKLDYLWNKHNPDYRYGAYIRLADFPAAVSVNLAPFIDPSESAYDGISEGYILRNIDKARKEPGPKDYVKPVPQNQIKLYKANGGYVLTQTKEWQKN